MDINTLLVQGLTLGLAANILPGPMMIFSLSQIIKRGTLSEMIIQFGATAINIVRIALAFMLFSVLPQNEILFGLLSLFGAIFLLYMAYGNFTYKSDIQVPATVTDNPFLQGVLGNILNAAAYIFWLTVGGPIILSAGSIANGLSFALGFLISITLCGIIIALVAGRIKVYLASNYYVYVIRLLGIVLIIFAVLFFKQALSHFSIS